MEGEPLQDGSAETINEMHLLSVASHLSAGGVSLWLSHLPPGEFAIDGQGIYKESVG